MPRSSPYFTKPFVASLLTLSLLGLSACDGGTPAPRSISITDPGPLNHPTPLKPSQILEGKPETHTVDVYTSADGKLFVAYWSASAGRFTWDYAGINEVITILEGEAFVKTDDGVTHHLKPGVTLTFGAGDHAEWHVPNYIRKVAVVQSSPPPLTTRIANKLKKLIGN